MLRHLWLSAPNRLWSLTVIRAGQNGGGGGHWKHSYKANTTKLSYHTCTWYSHSVECYILPQSHCYRHIHPHRTVLEVCTATAYSLRGMYSHSISVTGIYTYSHSIVLQVWTATAYSVTGMYSHSVQCYMHIQPQRTVLQAHTATAYRV